MRDAGQPDAGDAPEELARALSAAAGTTTSEVEAERGGSRVRALVDSPQVPRDFTVVLYDGETFFAAGDDGFTELGGSLGGLFADLADIGSEEVGRALEEVRDEGPATVDGRQVERSTALIEIDFSAVAGPDAVVTQTTEVDQAVRDAGAAITIPPPRATRQITSPAELGAILS